MKIHSKYIFYGSLLLELLFSPWLYLKNYFRWRFGIADKANFTNRQRKDVQNNSLAVCIHEWGGYKGKRERKIKQLKAFGCGLDHQLKHFLNYRGKYKPEVTITISDSHLRNKQINHPKVLSVSNAGMDFSGYEAFYLTLKDKPNRYVILTNSSVHKHRVEFIDDYLDFFGQNESIGIMGISFNTKMRQTLITNNFNPHLQSFFILTTTEVLNEVVEKNKVFPGKGIDHKLLLIRQGEIRLSNVILELGYQIACVLENGKPYIFDKTCLSDNGRNSWKCPLGDYRFHVRRPNAIHAMKIKPFEN